MPVLLKACLQIPVEVYIFYFRGVVSDSVKSFVLRLVCPAQDHSGQIQERFLILVRHAKRGRIGWSHCLGWRGSRRQRGGSFFEVSVESLQIHYTAFWKPSSIILCYSPSVECPRTPNPAHNWTSCQNWISKSKKQVESWNRYHLYRNIMDFLKNQ